MKLKRPVLLAIVLTFGITIGIGLFLNRGYELVTPMVVALAALAPKLADSDEKNTDKP